MSLLGITVLQCLTEVHDERAASEGLVVVKWVPRKMGAVDRAKEERCCTLDSVTTAYP